MTKAEPSRYVSPGGDLPLTNLGQLELLRAMMERGLSFRTSVRGFSMMPLIRDEDVVTIAPVEGRDPRVGEVVAFVTPRSGKLALHRIVARQGAGWLLRGDGCRENDGLVAGEDILGRVVRVEREGSQVRFGSGLGGGVIAWVSLEGGLAGLNALRRTPRRVASRLLRGAQGFRLYRALGRRTAPRVSIGEASDSDLEVVHRRFGSADAQSQPALPADPSVSSWVAKRRGRVVGFVQLVPIEDTGSPWVGEWLFSLFVRGRYRGLGVGGALTERVIEAARARGAAHLSLAVFNDNEPAIRLYRKLLFEPTLIDTLEPGFAEEERLCGRRRMVMRKAL